VHCRIKLRSYRTKVCGTCVASSYIRAFRYVCGQLRALLPSGRSAKSHLGEWIRVSSWSGKVTGDDHVKIGTNLRRQKWFAWSKHKLDNVNMVKAVVKTVVCIKEKLFQPFWNLLDWFCQRLCRATFAYQVCLKSIQFLIFSGDICESKVITISTMSLPSSSQSTLYWPLTVNSFVYSLHILL